jgi:glutamine synthetase
VVQYIKESKAIRFEGNGYSDEWKAEAAARGLSNFPSTPDALAAMVSAKTAALYTKTGVFSEKEIHAHHEVQLHSYATRLKIESRTLGEMCANLILPAAIGYQTKVAQNIAALKALDLPASAYEAQMELVHALSENINGVSKNVLIMTEARHAAMDIEDAYKAAVEYCEVVKPLMETIREYADRLEYLVEDAHWPLPKYREMFYLR